MTQQHTEQDALAVNGWTMVLLFLIVAGVAITAFFTGHPVIATALAVALGLSMGGFIIVPPGEGLVTTLFGSYSGSVKDEGFLYIIPFVARTKISLKANNLTVPTLKVNDKSGNPVDIGAAVVWRVTDTALATFSVEDYHRYIAVQAEAALRHVAGSHPYDSTDETSLRNNADTVTRELINELNRVAGEAGLTILDARITHLAYSAEVAQGMLRRQQADAVVAARKTIVEGAVTLVSEVVEKLKSDHSIVLTETEQSRLVVNLLTVMVSDRDAQPVLPLNTN